MPLSPAERALRLVLRLNGGITLLALVAVFMPLDWMAQTHRRLGLGDLPQGPVFEYLARTVSFMYVIHGGLCLLLATDVRRFGPVITFVASLELVFAAFVLWIDSHAKMPLAWTLIEAPLIVLFSGLTLALRLRAARTGAG
jgi:hypothetical protein